MFASRLRSSKNPYECLLIYDVSNSLKGCQLEFYHPLDYPVDDFSKRLTEFLLPCEHKHTVSEQYTLVFTESDGKLDFVVCLSLPMSGYIICIRSFHPWLEFMHEILTWINQAGLYAPSLHKQLREKLQQLKVVGDFIYLPGTCVKNLPSLSFPVPDSRCHPFYHRYILEFYTSLSISNWIIIFESILLEKSVIFYSNRFQRITSCIFACLSLIYPLVWVHLIYPLLPATCFEFAGCPSPFIAGVHSCMLEKVKDVVIPGVRFVDLDSDQVYATGPPHHHLPGAIRQWLFRRCNTSHKAILRNKQIVRNVAATAAAYLVEPYLETMAILLGGYRNALHQLTPTSSSTFVHSKEAHPSMLNTSSQSKSPRWIFDRDLFIASRGKSCQSYLRELLQSQMVVQFFESRLALLNSELGIIPSDDFEDCVQHVRVSSGSKLTDALTRRHPELFRIAKKLSHLGRKHRNNFDRAPRLWAFHIPLSSSVKPTSKECQLPSNSDDIRSSSSSPDSELYESSENVVLPEDGIEFPELTSDTPKSSKDNESWRSFEPFGDPIQLESEKSRRSLLSSVFEAIPDLPLDWLRPPPTNLPPSLTAYGLATASERFPEVASSDAITRFPKSKTDQDFQKPNSRSDCSSGLLDMAVPLRPTQATTHPDDLASFLRQLDPMHENADNDDLLK